MQSESIADLENWLLEKALPSGGWGYYPDKSAFIEPTCLALLALQGTKHENSPEFSLALKFLESCVQPSGVVLQPGGRLEAIWPTSIVLFTFLKLKWKPEITSLLASILLKIKGVVTKKNSKAMEIHGSDINLQLVGWPWTLNNFSWVEPTSWAVLSLRLAGLEENSRIVEGLNFLADRIIEKGGANYGNKTVLGKLLDPVPVPTALCLLALQNTLSISDPKIVNSLAYLRQSIENPVDLENALWAVITLLIYTKNNSVENRLMRSATYDILAKFIGEWGDESQPISNSVQRVALALIANKSLIDNPFELEFPVNPIVIKKVSLPVESWSNRVKNMLRRMLITGLGGIQVRQKESVVTWGLLQSYHDDMLPTIRQMYQPFRIKVPLTGKKVFIKPNIVEFNFHRPIHTNPMVVEALIRFCIEEGAREIVVGEGSGHRRNMGCLLRECGLEEILIKHKIRFVDINYDEPIKVTNLGSSSGMGYIYFSKEAYQSDVLISVPKLKTHHWTSVTLSLKNMFGIASSQAYGWPKNELHFQGIVNSIVDINCTRKPDLSLVDGIMGMQGDGPLYGEPVNANFLLMGDDSVAVDSTCSRWMGFDPGKIDHIKVAHQSGLGNIDSDKIKIVGFNSNVVPKLNFLAPPNIDAY